MWGGPFIAILLIVMANMYDSSQERFGFYGDEWGLKLPDAYGVNYVLGARPIPEENRASLSVFIYEDSDDFSKITGLKKVSEENLGDVQKIVQGFRDQTIQYADFIEEQLLKESLEEYLPDPREGDLYYYKENRKGSYFFALVKDEESKIYTFQWLSEPREIK